MEKLPRDDWCETLASHAEDYRGGEELKPAIFELHDEDVFEAITESVNNEEIHFSQPPRVASNTAAFNVDNAQFHLSC